MRDLLITVTSFIFLAAIEYGLASFVAWEWNPTHWHPAGRFVFVLVYLVSIALIVLNYKPNAQDPEQDRMFKSITSVILCALLYIAVLAIAYIFRD